MADLSRTISIIFSGQNRLGSAIREVEQSLVDVSVPVSDLATKLATLDAALLAIGTAFLVSGFNKAKVFESAVVDLNKVLGEGENIEQFKQAAIDLSEVYGQSAATILQTTADYKQAGFTAEEAMQLTKNGMDLVIAGGVEASEASEIFIATLKGFDAPASDAGRLMDVLNEVSNQYATSVGELGVGMAKLSPIAKQAGLSFEETAGILVPVIEVFRSGDEAAIALKTGLLKLIDDSKPVADALDTIGVAQKDANDQLRPAGDILQDVAEAFQTADEADKLFLATQLVGIDQAARMVTVFDGMSKTLAVTDTALNSAGSAAEEVALRLATAEIEVDRFSTAFENVQVAVGNQFLMGIKEAIGGATELEIAFRKAVDAGAFDELFDALQPQLVELDELFRTVAQNLPEAFEDTDFSPIVDSLEALGGSLGEAFAGLLGDIDVSTPENLAEAIQRVVDTIAALTQFSAGFIKGFQPVFDIIGESTKRFSDMDQAGQQTAGQIGALATMIVEFGSKLTAAMVILNQSGADIEGVFDVVAGSIGTVFNALQLGIDGLLLFSSKLASLGGTLLGVLSTPFEEISQAFHGFADDADVYTTVATQDLAKNTSEMFDSLVQVGEGFSLVSVDAENMTDKTILAMDKTKTAISDVPSSAEVLEGILSQAADEFDRDTDVMSQALEKVPQAAEAIPPATDKVTVSLEKMGATEKSTAKDADELALAMTKLTAEFARIDVDAAKVLHSFADLDLSTAKLAVDTEKAGLSFGGIGTHFTDIGRTALEAKTSFQDLETNLNSFSNTIVSLSEPLSGMNNKTLNMALSVTEAGTSMEEVLVSFQKADTAAAEILQSWAELDLKAKDLEYSTPQILDSGVSSNSH